TSCYVFATVQHIHAVEPFIHYSSPRFLRDAKEDVEHVTNNFHKIFHTLKASREFVATVLQKELDVAKADRASTSLLLEMANNDAEVQRAKIAEQEAQLEKYKLMLQLQASGSGN
ncbi:hypothetical protein B0H17DRAFT_963842, partial [Mycena rosella]